MEDTWSPEMLKESGWFSWKGVPVHLIYAEEGELMQCLEKWYGGRE